MTRSPRYPEATWQPSPNYNKGRDPGDPQWVTLHITDGGPRLDRTVAHLCKPSAGVSAHFVVGRTGTAVQLVELADRAWHAKDWNSRSIGIEHVARTPGELKQWAQLSYATRADLLDDSATAEQINSATDPGLPLTSEQLVASAKLVAWICRVYGWVPSELCIKPHCACPGTTHTDCGLSVEKGGIFPWPAYFELIQTELAQ
jgi:N-acetyl-anhydromuramyl-L-alanine amidase AmpD